MEEYISLSSYLELLEMLLCWNEGERPEWGPNGPDRDKQGCFYGMDVLFLAKTEPNFLQNMIIRLDMRTLYLLG